MKKLSKLVSLMLSLVLCIGMASPAFAIEYDIETGRVHVENGDDGNVVSWQENHETNNSKETASTDKEIVITGTYTDTVQFADDKVSMIDVGKNVKDTTITLKDVTIDTSVTGGTTDTYGKKYTPGKAALSIGEGSDVTVELQGENILKSGCKHAGLELNDGASVTIQAAEASEGSLKAEGGKGGAGIGSQYLGNAGNITISGGASVTATGGRMQYYQGGAGIGAGGVGTVGNILISDGAKVTATGSGGGYGAAGIGSSSSASGYLSTVGDITISGGATVSATGKDNGAGIGSGWRGKVGNIKISGAGTAVTAQGSASAAGIGTGFEGGNSSGSSITISDKATVTAEGGAHGAGIGSGNSSSIGDITISGGATVSATGKSGSAGIGAGWGSNSVGNIVVTDCESVTAIGSLDAYRNVASSGIGAGAVPNQYYSGKTGNITVKNNKELKVQSGGEGAADIGAGKQYTTVGDIEIRQFNDDGSLSYVHHPKEGDRVEYTVTAPAGKEISINEDLTVTIPAGSTVTSTAGGEAATLSCLGTIGADGTLVKHSHEYQSAVTTPAKCTEAGVTTYTCKNCGDSYTEEIQATGHKEVTDAAKDPNCTEKGLTEGKHCSVCGEATVKQEEIPANGHTVVIDEVVPATTTSTGLTEGSHCGVCGEVLVAQEEIPMRDPEEPDTPVFPVVPDNGASADVTPDEDTTTLEDQEVPLAGLMPVAQLLEELRLYEKIEEIELPEDFKWIDHEYAQAICWALQKELVVDTEEEPFDPDEVITVALMREVLTNFVKCCKGLDDFVVTLEGEDDELVMDLGERLTAFYGELETYLKAQEAKAA